MFPPATTKKYRQQVLFKTASMTAERGQGCSLANTCHPAFLVKRTPSFQSKEERGREKEGESTKRTNEASIFNSSLIFITLPLPSTLPFWQGKGKKPSVPSPFSRRRRGKREAEKGGGEDRDGRLCSDGSYQLGNVVTDFHEDRLVA